MTADAEIIVQQPGWLTTLQDLGRAGSEHLGVPVSGASDQYSATVGNVLVGNARGATLIEIMATEFSATVTADLLIAVTGATADVWVSGHRAPMWAPLCVPAGSRITIRNVRNGIRTYLCVNGELETDRFLGSAAPDARMGFPQRLGAGQRVRLRTDYVDFVHPYAQQPLLRLPVRIPDRRRDSWVVDVTDGPETAAVEGIRDLLESSEYTVTDRSNHVGLRLSGPVAHPEGLDEIISHGVPIGGVEIPHSDELIILGRARSLTAGYPIVAVVTSSSMSALGQAGPGQKIRIRWSSMEDAIATYRSQQADLDELEEAVQRVFDAVNLPHHTRVVQPTA
ncbi:5-oxoprolinase subunit C family protein [Rhodococcus opacus]|uniref:5-oxoprolinase subunit C family protein n=1 Tax=Rhodococcus opacus TaxID=37919 RepID=UPI002235CFFF|nr:biotin-dependent carboxyltransferase family protein [Rhodococcus opacus]UZG55111.1 biotin-dependent carboxyltransferase family protein [Rhodococcus opacus]